MSVPQKFHCPYQRVNDVRLGMHEPLVPVACDLSTDRFWGLMYEFHLRRGWRNILIEEIAAIVRFACNVAFLVLLVGWTDWTAVERRDLNATAVVDVLTDHTHTAWLCLALGGAVVAARVLHSLRVVWDHMQVREVYRNMGLLDIELRLKQWSEVVATLRRSPPGGLTVPSDADIAQQIMRRENVWIALLGADILPNWVTDVSWTHGMANAWIERYVVDQNGERRRRLTSERLVAHARAFGAFLLLVSPITLLFCACAFLVSHANDIRRRTTPSIIERDFTSRARTRYRAYNELAHEAEARFARARPLMAQCTAHFPMPCLEVAVHVTHACTATLMLYLFLITVLNEQLVIAGQIGGHSILWVMGTCSLGVAATASARVPPPSNIGELQVVLRRVERELHTKLLTKPPPYRDISINSLHDMRRLYSPVIVLKLRDIFGCVAVPYFLLTMSPSRARALTNFVDAHIVASPRHRGVVCDFALQAQLDAESTDERPAPPTGDEPTEDERAEDAMITRYLSASELGDFASATPQPM